MKGFALFLSLMLILILSVFACCLLLVTQSHYAASRALFESDNARIVSDAALHYMLQLHNHQQPRFFQDPQRWNQLRLQPFFWNGYRITGTLANSWNPLANNLLTLRADKGRYASEISAQLRQLRLEDFALFSDGPQSLPGSTLFEGKVYSASSLALNDHCRFRDLVFNPVSPDFYASYRRKSDAYLDFATIKELCPAGWNAGSLAITGKSPVFWQTDHYLLDLDALDLSFVGKRWRIFYKGKALGDADLPGLTFDDRLEVRQTYREIPWFASGKPDQSFFVVSSGDLIIKSSIQSLLAQYYLGFGLVSSKKIIIDPQDSATRIQALLVSFEDFIADSGSTPMDAVEQQSWEVETRESAFLVEPEMKINLSSAITNHEKVLWFRGTVAVHGELQIAKDVTQVHFASTRTVHSALESFPYVELVEGDEQWQ
jgi:hypothetical protein